MAAGGLSLNGFWKRKHPEGGEGAGGRRKRGTEGSSGSFVVGWTEEKEEKKRVREEGAINFATDEGHRGASGVLGAAFQL